MDTEIEKLKAQLEEAKAAITKMSEALSDKADGVREWYAALKGKEYDKRTLGLEAKCLEKDEALKEARKHLVFDKQGAGLLEAGALDRAIGQIDAAITTTGNTLLERVKGLESDYEVLSKERNAYAKCHANMEKDLAFYKQSLTSIANELGIIDPIQLIMAATNNEETYVDILIKILRQKLTLTAEAKG